MAHGRGCGRGLGVELAFTLHFTRFRDICVCITHTSAYATCEITRGVGRGERRKKWQDFLPERGDS